MIKIIGNGAIDDIDIRNQRDTKLKEYSKYADPYLEYCGFLKEKYNSKLSKGEIRKIRYEIAESYLKEKVDYKPNAEQVLKYLKEKGFILAVASATNDHVAEYYKKDNMN